MTPKFYAGIGSRDTPNDVMEVMREFAYKASRYFFLRSGGARGADSAFQKGAGARCHEYGPQDATEAAMVLASHYHPAWDRCTDFVRKLHGRNIQIILGKDLLQEAEFVVCWTPGGKAVGGTATGIRCAIAHSIPVYNLALEHDLEAVLDKHRFMIL